LATFEPILIFEPGRKFSTSPIIKLQYGNRRIFYNKLTGYVISQALGFCRWVLPMANTKALDFIIEFGKSDKG